MPRDQNRTRQQRVPKPARATARFLRSTNVERDRPIDTLHGYVPTSRALELVERVVDSLENAHGLALSVIGPYGSGKSSAVQFLLALVAGEDDGARRLAAHKLRTISPDLDDRLKAALVGLRCKGKGIDRATAVARREPVTLTVGRALDLEPSAPTTKGRRSNVADDTLIQATVDARLKHRPLLLVLDEFGKNLEHFAENPAEADLFLLQQLAERAVAESQTPLLLITLQHLAFEDYISLSTPVAQREWAKVQGRFSDFPFAESTRQVRKLIGAALETLQPRVKFSADFAKAHFRELERMDLQELIADWQSVQATWPLHPLAVLALPELCTKYAQNERTLFAFLRSDDPGALPQFAMRSRMKSRTLLGLEALFDYFVESARSQLMAARGARRWLEVESRISDAKGKANPTELAVLKSVGVLNLVTAGGSLRASKSLVEYSCVDDPGDAHRRQSVTDALNVLVDIGLLTYRSFADEYRVWAGSDFDLSAAFERAHLDVSHVSVAGLLQEFRPRLPMVAGRFSLRSGSIRAFECRYVDDPDLVSSIQPSADVYDGVVAYWVGANKALREASNVGPRPLVFLEGADVSVIRRAAVEVAAYRRVLAHTPQLEQDWVARRELVERLMLAEQRLDQAVWATFDSGAPSPRLFRVSANRVRLDATRLSAALSEVAETAYEHTPRIANEVVNRHELTSQGAAARRTLMEAMLTRPHEMDLGIKGFGPERTMYLALLHATGLHRQEKGEWTFTSPPKSSDVYPAWAKLQAFLDQSRFGKVSVGEVFGGLAAPPYGVKAGPLPVLLTALLVSHSDDVAVYEHGTYQPELSPELLERLAKNPSNFEIRSFALRHGARMAVIDEALREFKLPAAAHGRNSTLISAVRPILNTFRSMPEYARCTRRLEPTTVALRQALLDAREPDQLLFVDLPKALGLAPFVTDDSANGDPKAFVAKLKAALKELQGAFPALLARITSTMASLLGANDTALRQSIRDRSGHLVNRATGTLGSFLIAAADPMHSDEDWLQRLASGLIGKPPKVWRDEDEVAFDARVRDAIGAMRRLEFLYASPDEGMSSYRVCLTLSDGEERILVSPTEPPSADLVALAENVVEQAKAAAGPGGPAALVRQLIEVLGQHRQTSATTA